MSRLSLTPLRKKRVQDAGRYLRHLSVTAAGNEKSQQVECVHTSICQIPLSPEASNEDEVSESERRSACVSPHLLPHHPRGGRESVGVGLRVGVVLDYSVDESILTGLAEMPRGSLQKLIVRPFPRSRSER